MIATYEEKIKKLTDALDAAQKELTDSKAELSRFAEVVLVRQNSITVRSGHVVMVGEVIPFGPFKGQKIQEINREKRTVLLADGSVLFLLR